MTARETILRDIRRGLGNHSQTAPPPVRLRIPQVSTDARIKSMLDRVTALGGHALHTRSAVEAVDHVSRLTDGHSRIIANSPFLRDLGFVAGGADCAAADFGITSAEYALSDTGSLVMLAGSANARLISLLPPVHIALIPSSCLLTGLDELFTLVPKPADLSSSMVFITGPSRTADIEQILVRGVHGPGEIHVVIID